VEIRARRRERWLIAVVAATVILAFLFGAIQRFLVCDDAFISFRYARHLAEGQGLVWNPEERVEGYTNFLWVLVLAAGSPWERGRSCWPPRSASSAVRRWSSWWRGWARATTAGGIR